MTEVDAPDYPELPPRPIMSDGMAVRALAKFRAGREALWFWDFTQTKS